MAVLTGSSFFLFAVTIFSYSNLLAEECIHNTGVEKGSDITCEQQELTKTTHATIVEIIGNDFKPGQDIVVNIKNLPGNKKDWITLVKREAPANKYGKWFYTNGVTEGEWTFKAPPDEGEYEIRVFYNYPASKYEIKASKAFNVETLSIECPVERSAHIELSAPSYTPGEKLEITFKDLPGKKGDWITLVPENYSSRTYGQWKYTDGLVNGDMEFDVPSKIGQSISVW